MRRALQIARLGYGKTASNPLVGAVVVKNGKIISEGYHKVFGGAHAEVNALFPLSEHDCRDAELYVSLEPCNHFGKTPPCTDIILQKKIKHVVVAMRDPNPLVSGKGIEKLREHGVIVTEGLLEKEAINLNAGFVKWVSSGMPYVILKWAQTADGYMGSGSIPDTSSGKISSRETRILVHRWRSESQAILTGRSTIQADNPQLNARFWQGDSPVRMVIDPEMKITDEYIIMSDGGPTIILNAHFSGNKNNIRYLKFEDMNMRSILSKIGAMGISSIITEAGPYTLNHLLKENLWDEIRMIQSSGFLHRGIAAPTVKGILSEFQQIGEDRIFTYKNIN